MSNNQIILLLETSNLTLSSENQIYELFGYTTLSSRLFLYLLTPTAIIGFITNMVSFIVLMRKEYYKIPLYIYLKVILATSLINNILQLFFGLSGCRRDLDFGNRYSAVWYVSMIYTPVMNTLLFYKFLMDCLIVLDRISTFKPNVKRFIIFSPVKNSIILLVCVFILNSLHFLLFSVGKFKIFKNDQIENFYLVTTSDFAKTFHGRIVSIVLFFIRHALTSALELTLNMISAFYFRQYLSRKIKLVRFSRSSLFISNNNNNNKNNKPVRDQNSIIVNNTVQR